MLAITIRRVLLFRHVECSTNLKVGDRVFQIEGRSIPIVCDTKHSSNSSKHSLLV